MFQDMVGSIKSEAVGTLFKIQPAKTEEFKGIFSSLSQQLVHPEAERFQKPPQPTSPPIQPSQGLAASPPLSVTPQTKNFPKVGRNDPCPCGKIDPTTGKPIKYKKCHGR